MQGFILPSPLFVIITGQGNNGKTWQMARLLRARAPGGEFACLPAVIFRAEASGEGTMGDLLADRDRVLVWPVSTADDVTAALKVLVPAGVGPVSFGKARELRWQADRDVAIAAKREPPPKPQRGPCDDLPIRALAVDSASKVHKGQMDLVRDEFNSARGKGAGRQSVSGKDHENNNMRVAGLAAGRVQVMVDHLYAAAKFPILVVCSVHTRGATETTLIGEGAGAEKVERVIGEAPDFGAPKSVGRGVLANGYAALWNALATSANIIAHAYAVAPDFSAASLDDINAPDPDRDVKFGLVCTRGTYPGLGYVGWPKRQECDGWLGNFALAPRLWHPDIPWSGREAFAEFARGLPSGTRTNATTGEVIEYDGGPDLGILLEACLAGQVSC